MNPLSIVFGYVVFEMHHWISLPNTCLSNGRNTTRFWLNNNFLPLSASKHWKTTVKNFATFPCWNSNASLQQLLNETSMKSSFQGLIESKSKFWWTKVSNRGNQINSLYLQLKEAHFRQICWKAHGKVHLQIKQFIYHGMFQSSNSTRLNSTP